MMNNEEDIAIRIQNLRKEYRLGVIGYGTIRQTLESWWARIRGKCDPNLRIGFNPKNLNQEFLALNGVDLTVHRGERLGIIGRNGAGKSTLLKILCRITAPTEGDIDIYGRISSMLEIGTGFHGELTGRENVYMNGAILGMTEKEIDSKMQDIIDFSEVGEFIDTPVKRYSSGMFVKLAFSVAAHLEAEIVIMDEVLAVGDLAFQQKCLDKMRKLSEETARTILYVSHNMSTIRRLCNRCIVLKDGKIVYDGDVERAIAAYMDMDTEDPSHVFDLKNKIKLYLSEFETPMLEELFIEDGCFPVYSEQKYISMIIKLNVPKDINDLHLVIRVVTTDGIILGTALTEALQLRQSSHTQLKVRFFLDKLAKGNFYVNLGLCRVIVPGRLNFEEYGENIFRFRVLGIPGWNCTKSGYADFSVTCSERLVFSVKTETTRIPSSCH